MRIQFEIKEKLPDIIGEILNSEKWMTLIKEDISGRKLVVIRDQAFDSEATVEIYSREVTIKTAWSRYTYRLFVLGDCVWCEYNGAYRGLLEQNCCHLSPLKRVCWIRKFWTAHCMGMKRRNFGNMLKIILN